eukprot:1196824-Rhodomonas_salina.1
MCGTETGLGCVATCGTELAYGAQVADAMQVQALLCLVPPYPYIPTLFLCHVQYCQCRAWY